MMQLSSVISDVILAAVSLGVFFRFFSGFALPNRLLWGAFFVTITMAAMAGALRFAGVQAVVPAHDSLQLLAGTVGILSVVMAIWSLVTRQTFSMTTTIYVLFAGILLFLLLSLPVVKPFASVVQSLGMLATMLVAVYGLLQKYQKATWIIVGVMTVGIATKMPAQNFINAIDLYHYSLTATLLCFGKAA